MHDEQQRQPDARTQQVLGRVRRIIIKKNTQFILDHQHDSLEALSLYLRDCMEDIGHPPARVEVIGGDFLEYRFGSWQKALRSIYDGKASEFLKNPPAFANRKIVRDLCAAAADGDQLLQRQIMAGECNGMDGVGILHGFRSF